MFRVPASVVLALLGLFCPLLCVAAPQTASAAPSTPVVDLLAHRQQITPVAGAWRFHAGDNPAWSEPSLDDTAWKALEPTKTWAVPAILGDNQFAWFRVHLLVPPNTPSLVLQVPNTHRNYELFANGQKVGQVGVAPPGPAYPADTAARVFTLPVQSSPAPQTLTLAMRLWMPPSLSLVRDPRFAGPVLVGSPHDLLRQFNLQKAANLLADGGAYTVDIISLIVGLASLVLFLLNPRQRFYLWLACFVLLICVNLPVGYASRHLAVSYYTEINFYMVGDFLSMAVSAYLVLDLLGLPYRRALLPVLWAFLAEVGIGLVSFGHIPSVYANGIYFVFTFASLLTVLWWLLRGARAGSVDAQLLFLPLAVAIIPNLLDNLGHFLFDLGFPYADAITVIKYTLLSKPFPLLVEQGCQIASVLGLLGVVIYRFSRTTRERERLSSALQAAHDVQYQLVPTDLPRLGGLSTEVSYIAAEEVGGDFCQVLPREDGSMLLAIGDVSGKGLRAAMLGTLCVGALRSMADDNIAPGVVLDRLNTVVLRTEYAGFITCLCAHISATGVVRLSNAGHLAPYLNGTEVDVPSGLPLGIVTSGPYEEILLQLPDEARLTLLSDGVVEARSSTGELFGFDRTLGISRLSAAEIAAEARRYGPQQDDITVLTLQWVQAAVRSVAA